MVLRKVPQSRNDINYLFGYRLLAECCIRTHLSTSIQSGCLQLLLISSSISTRSGMRPVALQHVASPNVCSRATADCNLSMLTFRWQSLHVKNEWSPEQPLLSRAVGYVESGRTSPRIYQRSPNYQPYGHHLTKYILTCSQESKGLLHTYVEPRRIKLFPTQALVA